MRAFLRNFWVCLVFALFSMFGAAGSAAQGNTGWAWFMGILSLMWVNDARLAMNRDKEAGDEQGSGTPKG